MATYETYMATQVRQSKGLESLGVTGDGVYTTRRRNKGDVIAYYECDRIDDADLARIYGQGGTLVYSLTDGQTDIDGTFADAHRSRCVASLINDARGTQYENNVFFCDLSQPFAVRANRFIEAGEELFLDYGAHYWRGFARTPYRYETVCTS